MIILHCDPFTFDLARKAFTGNSRRKSAREKLISEKGEALSPAAPISKHPWAISQVPQLLPLGIAG